MMERYVKAKELAEMMGVSTRTIERMTAAGMPSETWGLAHVRRYRRGDRSGPHPAQGRGAPQ